MIGTIVGNYQLTDKLGEGGMGAVYKGVDLMLEREVAIKALRPELLNRADLIERFRGEAVTLAKLNHPNIATLYSFFLQANEYFMVMEYVPGETLESLIHRLGTLPGEQAAYLIRQALEGLSHAHKAGVIHRDIKLANLMLAPNNVVKVMDFGIARALGNDRMTRAGRMVGTIEYMAPEQIRGEEADARSDLYALGVALFELVTAQLPFNSNSEYELMRAKIEKAPPTPREIAPQISPELEQIILRALATCPENRFQSAEEFKGALLEYSSAAPTSIPMRRMPVSETRVNCLLPKLDPNTIQPTRLNQPVTKSGFQKLIDNFSWKHAAAVVAISTALVAGFVAFADGGKSTQKQSPIVQTAKSPELTPTPQPSLEAAPVNSPPAPIGTPLPTPVAVSINRVIATPTPQASIKPVMVKAAEKNVAAISRRTAENARRREAQRKRQMADEILSK